MKNFDVSLFERGLQKDVFTANCVLNLLYHPLEIIGITSAKKDASETISALTWSVNNFTEIPTASRKKLLELCFATDAQETTLELNRRFACVVYALLREQNDIMKNADWCTAIFDYASPNEVMQEICLWHKCGLKMNKAKLYLLKRIFENMLEKEHINLKESQLPVWISKQKCIIKQLLSANSKKIQRRDLKLTLTKSFIAAQFESTPRNIKELEALKKEARHITCSIEKLFEERYKLELKLGMLEIYQILQENAQNAA